MTYHYVVVRRRSPHPRVIRPDPSTSSPYLGLLWLRESSASVPEYEAVCALYADTPQPHELLYLNKHQKQHKTYFSLYLMTQIVNIF